jgi:ribosomal protein S1
MTEESKKTTAKKKDQSPQEEFAELLKQDTVRIPQVGDIVRGTVVSTSRSEVKVDIDGVMTGVVRGPQLFEEADEYSGLNCGDEVEATVIDEDNEDGEVELSFRDAGERKAWEVLRQAYKDKTNIKIKITEANKGGLMARYKHIAGFLPVSQLAPENYPRVSGGDKGKILEKLRSFAGTTFEVKVITLDEDEGTVIFSEKEAWSEKQKDVIDQYKIGTVVEGTVTAVTNFGVFISFGEDNKMEGLIHISELDWKRIDDPSELYQVGDEVKAEIIALEDSKIFLSAKKLKDNPWKDVDKKYQVGQVVRGEVLKVNPFGLFVKLSEDIHGLAHVSQLGMTREEKIEDKFKVNEEYDFEITSLVPKEHRLGLRYVEKKEGKKKDEEVKKDDSQEKLDSEEEKAEKKAENKKQEQDPDKDKNDKTQSQKTKKASSKPTSKASEDDKNDKEESDS